MKNAEIAALFEKSADVMAVLGENTFRVLAYRKIARTLEELGTDVAELAKSEALDGVAGIGESSAEKIREYLRTGKIGDFESLWSEVPAGVMEMMKIPTMGPKTAALLWREAGVKSVEELKGAIDKGTIKGIAGIGDKKLKTIRANIDFMATSSGRVRLSEAMPVALAMVEYLREIKGVEQVQYCGSLRRAKETIGDVDIAVAAEGKLAKAISDKVTSHPLCSQVIAAGESKTSIRTAGGLQVDVRVVPQESFGAAVQYFTGSKEHNVKLRGLAIEQGLKLNEWGLFRGEEKIAGETEEGIYAALGVAYVSPEMREDRGEITNDEIRMTNDEKGKDERRKTKDASGEEKSTKGDELNAILSSVPHSLPSGSAAGDALHKKYRVEILQILDAGYECFLPEIRWVETGDLSEETVKAIEAALIHEFAPPLNNQITMTAEQARFIINKNGAQEVYQNSRTNSDWLNCSSGELRAKILSQVPAKRKGIYVFKASDAGWTKQPIGYVGIAVSGKSDLKYRIKDHFQDDSGADNFADKFLQLFRSNSHICHKSKQPTYESTTVAGIADRHVGVYPVIEMHEIRGDLHMHTTASDGSKSIGEMVAEAKRRGLEYVAITDHSKSQFQANGLTVERLLAHVEAIHTVAREVKGILVLAGSEVDILADGSMDYEDEVLAKLDWVVASPHAALTQDAEAATARLVRAVANPYVHVIGHPTGRLVPSRKGLEPDMKKVIFAAARSGCALELNANTWRLDLRDTHLKMAVEAGVPVCINTDAHGFEDFDMLAYGVLYGRRGWLKAEHVLNTRPVGEFKKWLRGRRETAGW